MRRNESNITLLFISAKSEVKNEFSAIFAYAIVRTVPYNHWEFSLITCKISSTKQAQIEIRIRARNYHNTGSKRNWGCFWEQCEAHFVVLPTKRVRGNLSGKKRARASDKWSTKCSQFGALPSRLQNFFDPTVMQILSYVFNTDRWISQITVV